MNGTYKIPLLPDELPEHNAKVKRLLGMLPPGAQYTIKVWNEPMEAVILGDGHRESYNRNLGSRYVCIRAHGGQTVRRKHHPAKLSVAPPVPTVEQIEKRLIEAQKTLASNRSRLRENLRRQYRDEGWMLNPREWMLEQHKKRVLHKRIGRAVGRLLATKKVHAKHAKSIRFDKSDYATLDALAGHKVRRESQVTDTMLRGRSYLGWFVGLYAGSWRFGAARTKPEPRESFPNAIETYIHVAADEAYLAELYLLAIDRQAGRAA